VSVLDDHAQAFLTLLRADVTPPAVVVLDGLVVGTQSLPYTLVYFYISTPDGLVAPDKVSLDFDSDVIEMWAYCHHVGGNAKSARIQAGRSRAAVLNRTPVVTGRSCWPVRWREGQPGDRNEDTGATYVDLVDVYGFSSVPAS
jgi:hypothetical protein